MLDFTAPFETSRLSRVFALLLWITLSGITGNSAAAAPLAFPETFGIRLSSYLVRNADTDLTVLSEDNIGTGFSFVDDLGGDEDVDLWRLDLFYRFDDQHRVEFSTFRIKRDGFSRLTIDLDIGDQSYSVGETVISEITYELVKLGYAWSFYRSEQAEFSFTTALNQTTYEFDYQLVDGSSSDTSKASGPLPMLGFNLAYKINDKWSMHYLTEVLFYETDDVEGSIQNYELDFRYRWNESLVFGAGLARFSIDVDSEDDDWTGEIVDTHQGFLLFAGYHF